MTKQTQHPAVNRETVHAHLVGRAGRVAPRLATELKSLGPVWFRPRARGDSVASVLARSVVGQQLSAAAARTIWSRIGVAATACGCGVPAFFVPERADTIRACGVSGAKLRALCAIAAAHDRGDLEGRILRRVSSEDRRALLLALPGIGPWTCDMIEIFYFRTPDVWPVGDAAVIGTFRRYLPPAAPPRLALEAAPFAPFRSFLALALWGLVGRENRRRQAGPSVGKGKTGSDPFS